MSDNENELLNTENFDRMGKRKSISGIDNSSGDTVISKKNKSSCGNNTAHSGNNELLNSWKPIYFCKSYVNHRMARMMGVYVLLPSGVKNNTVKVSILGNSLF